MNRTLQIVVYSSIISMRLFASDIPLKDRKKTPSRLVPSVIITPIGLPINETARKKERNQLPDQRASHAYSHKEIATLLQNFDLVKIVEFLDECRRKNVSIEYNDSENIVIVAHTKRTIVEEQYKKAIDEQIR